MKFKLSLSPNPVLVKELRGRMRGPRAYLFLTGILVLLGLVSYGLYRIATFTAQNFFGGAQGTLGAVIGQTVFIGLVFLALMVICAISPSLTAGAISGEYERKTFDLLMATPLSTASILAGKLTAALSYTILIVLAAIPFVSLSFVFGGVALNDMLGALMLLLAFAFTFSVMGLFFSALVRRSGVAMVASYVVLGFFVFGTLFLYVVIGVSTREQPPNWILALNPFSAMASALAYNSAPNPSVFPDSRIGGPVFVTGSPQMIGPLSPLLWILGGGSLDMRNTGATPVWYYTVGIYAWLTVAMYLASTQLIKPVRRFHLSARAWLLVLLFLLISVVAAITLASGITLAQIQGLARWTVSSARELISNSDFTAPLDQGWTISNNDDATRMIEDGHPVLHLRHDGDEPSGIQVLQSISQTLPDESWLQLRATIRVTSQTQALCGAQGDSCPLMLKLSYVDTGGRTHEWFQGFYRAGGSVKRSARYCRVCEIRLAPIAVRAGEWYDYESPNLMQALSPAGVPRSINSFQVAASGLSFEADVARVSLLLREGRPVDRTGRSASFFTPTPAPPFRSVFVPGLFDWSGNSSGGIKIAPPIAVPPRIAPPVIMTAAPLRVVPGPAPALAPPRTATPIAR